MFSDRATAVFVRGRDVVSDPSRSTDLDVLGRLLTTITDDLIFDSLTLIERTKAGTFDSRDMDEHVSAAVLGSGYPPPSMVLLPEVPTIAIGNWTPVLEP